MKKALFIRKLFVSLTTVITAEVSAYLIFHEVHRDNIRREATSKLEEIMNQQEKRFGISYDHKPKLEFKVPNELSEIFAYYTKEDDTIHLNSESLSYDGDSIIDSYVNLLELNVMNYRPVLEHELGHFYYDQYLEKQGITEKDILDLGSDVIGIKLISEGIAGYFERAHSKEKWEDDFTDDEWPKDINNFEVRTNRVIYSGGYHLVKPIIDKYGLEGMNYLILNPPKRKDLNNLPSYQENILHLLY